jgi:hypothetical protein
MKKLTINILVVTTCCFNIATAENSGESSIGQDKEKIENQKDEYYLSVCNLMQAKKSYEAKIVQERKAAKISGFVDKNALYRYGKSILSMDGSIAEYSNEFKNKFKQNLDKSKCICDFKSASIGFVECKVKDHHGLSSYERDKKHDEEWMKVQKEKELQKKNEEDANKKKLGDLYE